MKKILLFIPFLLLLASCSYESDVASQNLSRAADQFEVDRRVVFYNWITWDYMLSIEGRCSLGNYDAQWQLTVTCKVWDKQYKKHFLGLSDNVTYFVEQLEAKKVSGYHYRVMFRPQTILPDIDFNADLTDIPVSE